MLRRDACRVTERVDELALFAGLNAPAFTAPASIRCFIAPFAMMHRAMHTLMTGIASPNGAVNTTPPPISRFSNAREMTYISSN